MRQALRNLRVPKAASRLFVYYAAQAEGFRPSLKRIEEETGLNEFNVSRTRALLVRYGLLGYNGAHIVIDWVRLSGIAAMDSSMIGKKKHWQISPVDLSYSKNDLHNYRGNDLTADERMAKLYEATAQAILDGVKFPELKDPPEIDPECVSHTKNDLHNYRGNEFPQAPWYDPFKEPDPPWVWQKPRVDAYGEIVAYDHFDPPPF